MNKKFKIFIGSDHGGFAYKEKVVNYFKKKKIFIYDLGNKKLDKNDDYTTFATKVAKVVAKNKNNRGILICRNGIGMNIAANKIKGIRAVITHHPKHARSSRLDDNTNILCLGQDYISFNLALKIINTWINSEFSNLKRHKRRLDLIKKIEKRK